MGVGVCVSYVRCMCVRCMYVCGVMDGVYVHCVCIVCCARVCAVHV